MQQIYQGTLFSALAGTTASASSPTVEAGTGSTLSVQVVWAGLTASSTISATVKVQGSNNDGATWTDIASATKTIDSAAGSAFIAVSDLGPEKIKLVYTKSDVTAGTITAHAIIKG